MIMGIIGNAQDAQFIRDMVEEWKSGPEGWRGIELMPAPRGWELLGEGCYRSAWLSPECVVYKVQHDYKRGYGQTNEGEYEIATQILLECVPVPHVSVPRFTYFSDSQVIAFELAEGESHEEIDEDEWDSVWQKRMRAAEEAYGLQDLHHDNVMCDVDNDVLIVIDLGY